MKGKKVLVTGASRGIGRAITQKLLEDGFDVYAIALDEGGLKKLKEDFAALGNVEYMALDLSDPKKINEFASTWSGPLYGIVNNAGICKIERLDEHKEIWDEIMKINLEAPHLLVKGLLKHLETPGRIVNISSQLGKDGRAGYSAYCASKFGLIGMTKCWAKELSDKKITSNVLCPGWVDTEMAQADVVRLAKEEGMGVEEFYKKICEPLELKRFTTPGEVAELVAFLVSSKASGITGRDWLLNAISN